MVRADYRGARGANAGDDFHELWALRHALVLLDQDTRLTAVTVEGLRVEDERGVPQDTWDGVDCTLYYGGDDAPSAECIVIEQLKYSAAHPDQAWTAARLAQSSNQRKDNSVVGRLAKAFAGLKSKRPDLVASGNVVVRLVSNQGVDPAVVNALSSQSTANQNSCRRSGHSSDRAALLRASGLDDEDFTAFARSLDLSGCGSESRFALEERVLTTISGWTDDDARAAVNDLMRFMRRAMMPEAKGDFITRQSILAQLGFSDPRALFPCSSTLPTVERLIPREASRVVVERMVSGEQRICLHGEGGCGKTTALQEIEALLSNDSVMIIFDCYGNGRYQDADAYRHRPQDAFLQLSNDVARRLRIPLLVNRSVDLDYPRVFKKRLEKAAEVVASRAGDALLVIVVDAADNSVTAASTRSPAERSFVHDFMALGDLPRNVRFVVTGRTGRLASLNLPREFIQREIAGFADDETAAHVRGIWNNASDAWIEDFHHLSRGNPRVQRYALNYAGTEPARALDYLRPHGKKLDQVFREQLKHARRKVGYDQDITAFCAGLVLLPRPVPIADLSAVTYLSEAHIRDLCADLAPGVRLTNGSIGFADEDFEHFVRAEAEAQLVPIQARIADYFVSRHTSDAYAATHVATALFVAGRGREIISLINTESKPLAIGDPVLRREAQLQRLRIAMKVCRETDDTVDAVLTLLIGAEALKTDVAIRQMLRENPDLAAFFARDTASRIILRDPDEIESHGPLLFHLMMADARDGDAISVREGYRQVQAWLQRRKESFQDQKREHPRITPQGWSINDRDIAAETEAVLRIAGPQQAVDSVQRWYPKSIALQIASSLASKLIITGETTLVERCITETDIAAPWDLFLLTPLALAGKPVNVVRLEAGLTSLLRRKLIRLDQIKNAWSADNMSAEYFDVILTACEVSIARGGNHACIIPVLECFTDRESRRRDRLFTSQVAVIDFSLRAHALIERLAGRKPTLETYWIEPPEPSEELPSKQTEEFKRADDKKKRELQDFIGPLVDIYDIRAQALLGSITPDDVDMQLRRAIASYHDQGYRFESDFRAREMQTRVGLSLTRLIALPSIDRVMLFERARSMLSTSADPLGSAETQIFASLALDRSLHQQILSAVTSQAQALRSIKASAEDKMSALIRLARLLLPISYEDAKSLFNEAIEVASEVNAEAVHEIALFAPFAEHAVDSVGVDQRRATARDLAIIVEDAGVRLAGNDHFPWTEAAQALTTLDACLALAATVRWEDSNLVESTTFLPPVLETALRHRELSPTQVTALSSLLDQCSVELTVRIAEEGTGQSSSLDLKMLTEELARQELLRFGQGTRPQISEKLSTLLPQCNPGFWLDRLAQATAFHQVARPDRISASREEGESRRRNETATERSTPLDTIDWAGHRFVSVADIHDVIGRVCTVMHPPETFVSTSTILDRMGTVIALGDRVAHLEALSRSESAQISNYELAQAISRRINEWYGTPAISHWCRERLMRVVIELLPGFSRWLSYGQSPLPALLKKSGVSDHQICVTLLEGMERHVDMLSAPTVYALVGLVGQYCTPDEAAQVIKRYANRLVQRIPVAEQDQWDLTDIPIEISRGVARFLYACMGDVDVRIRWRAAHALRCLARLGDTSILDTLVELYEQTSEPSYRKPDAPFYWLAARLWLMMALDRIAAETPSAVVRHGYRLLAIASDNVFPHVLIRSFAKSAVCKLLESGTLVLDRTQRDTLKRANTSPVRRKKARQPYYSVGFDRYSYKRREDRRFHFDMLDTLPYWYSQALRVFGNLDPEEFLDAAERWIVDCWDVTGETWRWDAEPRRGRLSERAFSSMDHSHGSRPTLERFHTYLEWHAMWCATGELMQTHALAKADEDAYDTFEHWLRREGLSSPPLWLADYRGPKPLDDRLWFPPQGDIDGWIESVGANDFLAEIGLTTSDGSIVVSGFHDTRSRNFMESAMIETALVSPDTASALVRALQTVDDSWDYRIPPAGHNLEIDAPPYKLAGWLTDVEHESGIDERDPFRYEVHMIEYQPAQHVVTGLDLSHDQAQWIEARSQSAVFTYEAWGDTRGDESHERLRYDETVRSHGWRLRIDKEALRTLLNKLGFDLIVEIAITRRNKGYDYSIYKEEKSKEVRFDRVVLLRRDGTLEAAEGRLGTWTIPCA